MVLKVSLNTGINRIRLEFKVLLADDPDDIGVIVLIESDWNLKDGNIDRFIREWEGINRIRLEFKV